MSIAAGIDSPEQDRTPQVGEVRTHPVHGPVRVLAVRSRTVRGQQREYLDLAVIGQDMSISLPLGQDEHTGLRDLIDEQQISELLALLAEPAPERPARESWAHRMKALDMQVQSGRLTERGSAIREILRKAGGQPPSSLAERNLLKSALAPLAAEIAIARGIDPDAARQLLVEACPVVVAD